MAESCSIMLSTALQAWMTVPVVAGQAVGVPVISCRRVLGRGAGEVHRDLPGNRDIVGPPLARRMSPAGSGNEPATRFWIVSIVRMILSLLHSGMPWRRRSAAAHVRRLGVRARNGSRPESAPAPSSRRMFRVTFWAMKVMTGSGYRTSGSQPLERRMATRVSKSGKPGCRPAGPIPKAGNEARLDLLDLNGPAVAGGRSACSGLEEVVEGVEELLL